MNARTVSVILLAGGTGQRMQTSTPKQFLPLKNKPVVNYSLEAFASSPYVHEIILVCDPQYRTLFSRPHPEIALKYALPGPRRQDSVYNGFKAASSSSDLICIHDSARPFITQEMIENVIQGALEVGAATLAVPVKFTVKESDGGHFVSHTPDRSRLWEIQTPQAVKPGLLESGFQTAIAQNITVTDDVSLVELIRHKVKLVTGSYGNIKITTPDDLIIAEQLLKQ